MCVSFSKSVLSVLKDKENCYFWSINLKLKPYFYFCCLSRAHISEIIYEHSSNSFKDTPVPAWQSAASLVFGGFTGFTCSNRKMGPQRKNRWITQPHDADKHKLMKVTNFMKARLKFLSCVIVCVWPDSSLDVPLLGPRWFLTSMLMAAALLVPALTLDSLLCYYCPLQHKAKPCTNITSQCLPNQRCSSSSGRYGSVHILSAQSCVDAQLCGSTEILSYRGVKYNVSHTCCCKDKCNGPPKSEASLKELLGIITDKIHVNITNVPGEERWDSCANYTSLSTTTLPAAAWKESL